MLTVPKQVPEPSLPFIEPIAGERQASPSDTWTSLLMDCHRLVERHAATKPDALAARFLEERLTYAELNRSANQLAHCLIQHGAGSGTRVAVHVQPSLDVLVCLLAILKAGAAYVPIDPSYPVERLAVILGDTRPCLVLTQAAIASRLPPLPSPPFCLEHNRTMLAGLPAHNPGLCPPPETAATVLYTSGTTGMPKGVVLSRANLAHYVQVARERYEFSAADAMPTMARFGFSISLFELLCPLTSGGTVIVLEREHVLDFRRLTRTMEQTTIMHASPHLWRKLLTYIKDQAIPAEAFASLRHVSSGGDMVTADLIEALKRTFADAEVFVIYGCSEIGCMGCTYPVPRNRTVRRNLVGKPFDNVSLLLLDDQRRPVTAGVPGEVYFAGRGVASGYLHRDDLTAERFVLIDGQRYYRTGDIGRLDDEGNLELLGRSDFQIKLRGIRIELGEIEATLRQAPGVRDGAVATYRRANHETALVAYLALAPESAAGVAEVRAFLRGKLPDYMIPAAFVILDALPVNLNQKIDRKSLPPPAEADFLHQATATPPRNDTERRLVAIWEKVLGYAPIGVQDDFLDIGGNSLLSISLMIEIEKEFGIAIPLSSILTAQTVERQAALIASASTVRASPVLLRPGDGAPALFLIHDGDGEVLPYRNLAFHLKPGHAVYGLPPYGSCRHPMLHTHLSDMVDHYLAEIRKLQASGPYFLGGLCIGGFIAFEIARRLRQSGEQVGLIALIDAAHVKAAPASVAQRRLARFLSVGAAISGGGIRSLASTLGRALGKIGNLVRYEISFRFRRTVKRMRLEWLRYCLDHGHRVPNCLAGISVDDVLRFAEKEYQVPAQPYDGKLLLLRATARDPQLDGTPVDDTPYRQLFIDPLLGWSQRARGLEVIDLPGGHSSMLQEPHVTALARVIQAHMDGAVESAAPLECAAAD